MSDNALIIPFHRLKIGQSWFRIESIEGDCFEDDDVTWKIADNNPVKIDNLCIAQDFLEIRVFDSIDSSHVLYTDRNLFSTKEEAEIEVNKRNWRTRLKKQIDKLGNTDPFLIRAKDDERWVDNNIDHFVNFTGTISYEDKYFQFTLEGRGGGAKGISAKLTNQFELSREKFDSLLVVFDTEKVGTIIKNLIKKEIQFNIDGNSCMSFEDWLVEYEFDEHDEEPDVYTFDFYENNGGYDCFFKEYQEIEESNGIEETTYETGDVILYIKDLEFNTLTGKGTFKASTAIRRDLH